MSEYISANLATQVKEDYMSYAMAVLIGRQVPDVYDGLKPVQRRLLQTMLEEGLFPDKRYVKNARITGLTQAFYHPHGSSYGALINMGTPWNNNVPWVDIHGNAGSTTDAPASERYTEGKLRTAAVDILLQDRAVWDTVPNYDGSKQEAVRLNSAVPTVLLNGDSGIAVGFATKLAPHSLRSVVEAVKLICKETSNDKTRLENYNKARQVLIPDFPTGPQIVQDEQLTTYTETGCGSIRCMARVETGVQKRDGRAKDRATLTFTHLPFGTNPEKIGEQIKAELERGRVEGVAEVNDLSDLSGDCIQVVAKQGVNADKLQQQLYAYTELDSKYPARSLVIDGTKPVELSPVEIVQRWVNWRLSKLQEKFAHELGLKESRLHIVEGLVKAIDKMDLIIKKIRAAKDKAEAKASLMSTPLKFSDRQAEAILEMRLRQLTNLDQSELQEEKAGLETRIAELKELAQDGEAGKKSRREYMVREVTELGKRHGEARRSPLVDPPANDLTPSPQQRAKAPAAAPKPRFMKVDAKKGTVEQAKGPRGALVVDAKEKVILMTEDGTLRKVAANFKGAVSTGYSAVSLAKREAEVSLRKYLTVYELNGELRAMVLSGEDLCRANSKGKKWLPEGAKLVHFGEGKYTVSWNSKRRKVIDLDLTVKAGKPGGKGIKVGNLEDIAAPQGK